MFWRMSGLSATSPVETILDKENFTLEELLDEDEIIQECKALNGRLINFLREREQVEQLVRYIVEEPAQEDAEKKRTFKFPFLASEIFTCEIDVILKILVEDEELMNLLFSFLEPKHAHSTMLAGYFSKVVISLLTRKTVQFMRYVKVHQEILTRLADLIGITSIMEVLIRLIGSDEHLYASNGESMQWIEDTDVLELIADKFSSSDSSEVHANAAEILCAITRFAPSGLAAKICSPTFIGRLFRRGLDDSRPTSVLVNSLSVCISLLDPKRSNPTMYYPYNHELIHGRKLTPNLETVKGMLDSLGDLVKLLDVMPGEDTLVTTYGKLQPPLGKHRLKIVEFISVLLTVSIDAAEKELIRIGAVQRIFHLFFEYPYNNFLHHNVENIILSCLESKNSQLTDHLLLECDLAGKILDAEKNCILGTNPKKRTVPTEGRKPPRIGNIGHLTRISNKLVQLANNKSGIQAYLQENTEWMDWHTNVLPKRNAVENVYSWVCGRLTSMHDRMRDSNDDDYQDRDYDVAALANNLSQAFQYEIYNNNESEEAHGSLERDDEDVYFDDESAEVVISSLRLGDGQESGSLFTNSNWFAFEDDRAANEQSTSSPMSSQKTELTSGVGAGGHDPVMSGDDKDLEDTATSSPRPEAKSDLAVKNVSKNPNATKGNATDRPPMWVQWREAADSREPSSADESDVVPNSEVQAGSEKRYEDDKLSTLLTGVSVSTNSNSGDLLRPTDGKHSLSNANGADGVPSSVVQVESEKDSEDEKPSALSTGVSVNTTNSSGEQPQPTGGKHNSSNADETEAVPDSEVQVEPENGDDDKLSA